MAQAPRLAGAAPDVAHRRAGMLAAAGTLPVVALVSLLVGVPTILLLTYAFRESAFAGVGPGPTLDQFTALWDSASYPRLVVRTLLISVGVSLIVTAFAVVVAFAVKFRLSRRVALIILGTALASGVASFLVRILAWGSVLGSNGVINSSLELTGVTNGPLNFLYFGIFAVIVTMVYVNLPIAILVVYGAIQDLDQHAVEAARDLGAGRWRTVTQVVLPQIRGSVINTFILTLILSSADYITPSLVGGTQGYMLGELIKTEALNNADLPRAAAMAFGFITVIICALAMVWFLGRVLRPLATVLSPFINRVGTRLVRTAPAWSSTRSISRPATIACFIFLVTPTLLVLVFSFNNSSTLGLPWEGFTTRWYGDIISRAGFGDALSTSLRLMVVGVLGAMIAGTAFAFGTQHVLGWRRRVLVSLAALPVVLPGILIGLGILTVASAMGAPLGYWPTAAAHVLVITPLVILVVSARLNSMNPELLLAARDLGSSPFRAFRTVTFPMILPSLIGAAVIGAAFSLDQLFVTTFTIGSETSLPLWIFGQARIGFNPGLNALGVMLVAWTLLAPSLVYVGYRLLMNRSKSRTADNNSLPQILSPTYVRTEAS